MIKEAAPGAKVEHIDCDLTSFESVKSAAKQLSSKCASGIDVVSNNAGSHIYESHCLCSFMTRYGVPIAEYVRI